MLNHSYFLYRFKSRTRKRSSVGKFSKMADTELDIDNLISRLLEGLSLPITNFISYDTICVKALYGERGYTRCFLVVSKEKLKADLLGFLRISC